MIAIRRATVADAAALARMRAHSAFERGGGDPTERDAYAGVCERFFAGELANAASFLRSWIAELDGEIVGAASLAVVPTLPRYGAAYGGFDGRVRDVYVAPSARRRGVARALMRAILERAKAERIDRLSLGASKMGMPLYLKIGFRLKPDEMVYVPE